MATEEKSVETTSTEPTPRIQRPPLQKQQLVIGLDFGTAFTKVVIGHQRMVRYAVPFNSFARGTIKNDLLLPSNLKIADADQECEFGYPDGFSCNEQDLKIGLINRDFSEKVKLFCAAYLALVLRYTRNWLLKTHEKTYRDRQIIWYINVGIPTESYDEPDLVDVYRKIVSLAWSVSVSSNPISLPLVRDYSQKMANHELPSDLLLPEEQINVFPEFAVQLIGYINSPQRQDGLHILADVGAGTFDFTTFNVHKNREGEDLFPIFSRAVKPLGTHFLVQHRMKNNGADASWKPSIYKKLPSTREFEKHLGLQGEQLHELDRPFRERVADDIRYHMKYTKKKGAPISQFGALTFLCGGGATADFYRNIFSDFRKAPSFFKMKLRSLIVPDDIEPLVPKELYQRLSVAYGLSFHPFVIPEIIGQQEMRYSEREPMKKSYRDNYIDKDQV